MLIPVLLAPLVVGPFVTRPVLGPEAEHTWGGTSATSPATPVPDVTLLRLAPDDVVAVARVRDVRRVLARGEASRWSQFLADPAWRKVLASLRDATPADDAASAARTESIAADLVTALADVRGAVAMVVGSPLSGEPPVFAFAALGGDGLATPLGQLLRGQGEATREGALELRAADGGAVEAYLRRGDLHLVVDAVDAATALAFGRAALARMDAGAPLGGRLAAFRDDVDVEFSFDLRTLWQAAERQGGVPAEAMPFWTALASIEWLHGRVVIGDGETLDLAVEAPYRDEGLGARLFGAFQPCDPTLLGLAPSFAISASAGKADLATLTDVVLAEIAANAPEQRDVIDAGLTALSETLGVDLRGDLLAGLTGDYLTFSLPADMVAAGEATTADARLSALDLSCTAFRIRDAEPFIAAVETTLDALAAAGVRVTSQELRGAEVWSTEALGRYTALAIHDGWVCLALDPDMLLSFLSRVNGDVDAPTSFLARPEYAAAARELAGTYVSLASTRATLAFLGNTLEVVGTSFLDGGSEADASTRRLGRVFFEAGKVTAQVGQRCFKGVLRGRVVVSGGRLLALTEAR